MESVLEILFSAENIRMLVLLVFGFSGYVLIKGQMKGLEYSLDKKIDGVEASLNKKIDSVEKSLLKAMDEKVDAFHNQLKSNDFKHINDTIEALTFTIHRRQAG
jgi:hypothetical protein